VDRDALRRLAAHQHGLISRAQANDAGLSRSGWYGQLASGLLREVQPGVAALEGAPPTAEQFILAAVLSLPGAVASHRSAAFLWGAELDGAHPVDVIAPRSVGARRVGVTIHRPRPHPPVRAIIRNGVNATTPVRTLLELGAVASIDVVEHVYEQFLVAGVVTSAAAHAALERHGGRGHAGAGTMRAVLERWHLGDRPPDSVLETALARLLLRYGLPEPSFQHEVHGPGFRYRLDFAYPEVKVAMEVDGWRYHAGRDVFETDRQRDAILQSAGWIVLRFTWLQVKRRPGWVAERVAATLAVRSRGSGARTSRPA
jgi:very-short-patch-repair endonuclease